LTRIALIDPKVRVFHDHSLTGFNEWTALG